MGGQENPQQEDSKSKGEVFGTMEGIYVRSKYIGRKGEFKKCQGGIKRL